MSRGRDVEGESGEEDRKRESVRWRKETKRQRHRNRETMTEKETEKLRDPGVVYWLEGVQERGVDR